MVHCKHLHAEVFILPTKSTTYRLYRYLPFNHPISHPSAPSTAPPTIRTYPPVRPPPPFPQDRAGAEMWNYFVFVVPPIQSESISVADPDPRSGAFLTP